MQQYARILVVDDDPDTREILSRVLESEYKVATASDGAEAMSVLESEVPDLIISDVMMPNADGYDLLEFLRSRQPTRDVPVILLSGHADSGERAKGLEMGAQDYVVKPLESGELRARVRIQLELAESRKASETRIRELTGRLVTDRDMERQRIGRDLHDQIGQQLTALKLQLEVLRTISREASLVERIEETQTIANQLDSDIDYLTWELHSTALECIDIVGALANYVSEWSKRYGVLADFQIVKLDQSRLSGEFKTNIYRIVQESLHNIAKHAEASHAIVSLEADEKFVVLRVTDDGSGFDAGAARPDTTGKGIGLSGMRERAAVLKAKFDLRSSPGEGTTITVSIPLAASPASEARATN
jgi:signal transduction histidine kinase